MLLFGPMLRSRLIRATVAIAIAATLAGCPKPAPAPKPADPAPSDPAPEAPEARPIPTVVIDEADRHTFRMASYAGLFRRAVQGYLQANGELPPDLPALLDSGFLPLLPIAPPPYRYQYIENLPDSAPHWQSIMVGFTPEFVELGFFAIPPGQPLDNPLGEAPMRTMTVVAKTYANEQAARDQDDPIPADWKTYVQNPETPPARRLDVLRRRSDDPATLLAIALYDVVDTLADRFTHTEGRMPANTAELYNPNFVPTPQFNQLQLIDPATPSVATIELLMEPTLKGFLKRITVHDPSGVEIGEEIKLLLDPDSELPHRSPLLVFADPNDPALDFSNAVALLTLRVPVDLALLQQASSAVEDKAEAATTDTAGE